MISTHFPEIREVVKGSGGRSINLHVEVKRKACGELDGEGFTYKILPGETQESTAFDVMRRVGFAVDIMDEARRVRGW